MEPELPPLAAMRPNPARLTRRTRRTTKAHEGLPVSGTADYADWSRLGAGSRRQDCQNGKRRLFRRFARKTFGNTDWCRFGACWRTPIEQKRERKGKSELAGCGAPPLDPGREKFSLHPRHVCDVPMSTPHRRYRSARQARWVRRWEKPSLQTSPDTFERLFDTFMGVRI